jgi:hypothetical protein
MNRDHAQHKSRIIVVLLLPLLITLSFVASAILINESTTPVVVFDRLLVAGPNCNAEVPDSRFGSAKVVYYSFRTGERSPNSLCSFIFERQGKLCGLRWFYSMGAIPRF